MFVNPDFEGDAVGAVPSTWTRQTNLNPGITDTRPSPQTLASLNLGTGGVAMTRVVGGAVESQVDPDIGSAGSFRFPKYGTKAARVNYQDATNPGKDKNVNVLRQTMTIGLADVDPIDDLAHVRFTVAPVLEDPGHNYVEQPYYFVRLQNVTTNTTIYQDFNVAGAAGVPWKTFTDTSGNAAAYVDWSLVDIAPGNHLMRIGDQVELLVLAAGCSLGGHWARIYVDSFGENIPGLFTWAQGPQTAAAGSDVTYQISYRNGGTTTTTGTKLDLVTPPNTTFRSTTAAGCTAPAVGAAGTLSCPLGTLAPSTDGTFTVTLRITAGTAAGTLVTNGNYSIYANAVSPLIGSKVSTRVTAATYSDVKVAFSDGRSSINWGQATSYTLSVTNTGPTAASSVAVANTVPAQLTGVTWTCSATAGGTCTAAGSGNIADTIALPVNATATYVINGTIIAGTGTSSIRNIATATVSTQTDPDTTSNTGTDITTIGPPANLTVSKTTAANLGTIRSIPAGLTCGTSCTVTTTAFTDGTQVELTASPSTGATFAGWTGACTGFSPTCTVTMAGALSTAARFAGPPTTATAGAGGGGQRTAINTAFAQPLSVTLTDSAGTPVSGVTVTFTVPGSGASATLSTLTAITNDNGVASVTATANATPGAYTVTATATGVATPASFALSNLGPPTSVTATSGGAQSATVTTAFAQPLIVTVRDAANQVLPGVSVTFTAPGTGASATPTPATVTTSAAGTAQLAPIANTVAGTYNVTATVTGVTPATFTLTNTAGAATTLALVSGNNQSTTVNTAFAAPFVASLSDAFGNPVAGATVSFAAPATGASATLSSPAVTDAQGRTSVTGTARTVAGTFAITVSAMGATPVSFTATATPGAPASIAITGGNNQTPTVNTAFGTPLSVTVLDAFGNPVPGASVAFVAPATGPRATVPATATTNASGVAQITPTAGTVAGSYAITATVNGQQVSFTARNVAGAATQVTAVSGGGQSATVNAAFASPLVAVVRDAFGNPVAGTTVTFTAPATGARATFSPATATSDASGQVSVTATAGTVAGTYNATASIPGGASATFALTNTAGPAAAIVAISGTPQSATVNTAFGAPLVVEVRDAFGNVVPNAVVAFAAPGTGASATPSAPTATSNASGRAQITATANTTAGSYTVTATVAGQTATFALTNTAGVPASIAVVSGSGQSAAAGTAFAAPLAAIVRDSFGNLVTGATVAFTAPAGNVSATLSAASAVTASDGTAQVTATARSQTGTYSVTASAGAGITTTFTLTNTAAAATTLVAISGGGQSATVNTAFAQPLVVEARDAFGNPVSGATITFAAPATGARATFSPATGTSNASGRLSVAATAGTVTGTYNATASLAGGGSATFALTNTAGPAAAIVAVSGTPQSAAVSAPFDAPLVVEVRDAFGNVVPGAVVAFAAPGTGASAALSTPTATSNAAGRAQITTIANNTTGGYAVTATVAGQTATFALSNTAGAPASIAVVSGSGQSTPASTAFAAPLVIIVRDSFGNLVTGATVTFTAPAGNVSATLSAATAVTGSDGTAQLTATARGRAGTYAVTASAGAGVTTAFTLTNTPGAVASLIAISGGGQSATVSTPFAAPLVVEARDAFDNIVEGATITFTAPVAGASASVASTATTGSDGRAQVTATAGTVAGSFAISASVTGVTPVRFALTNIADAPTALAIISGDPQSATVLQPFLTALGVRVTDRFGNPVAGVVVTLQAPDASGPTAQLADVIITTAADGTAATTASAGRRAGEISVTATITGATATFRLTATAAAPAVVRASAAGSPQAAQVRTTFAAPLAVTVEDAFGNPCAGIAVAYEVPGTGATAEVTSSATTDAAGRAQTTATANEIAGSYIATATVTGAPPASFGLTNLAGAPAQLVVAGGDEQSAIVDRDFAAALDLLVLDGDGNPVPGTTVAFAAPADGATGVLATSSVATDATGHATVRVRAGTRTGSYTVTATVAQGDAPALFALTNLPDAVVAITAVGASTPQGAAVATAYAAPLTAIVTDRFGNGIPGATVTFAAPATGPTGTLSSTTAITDASGRASVTIVAGNTAGTFTVPATTPGASAPASFSLTNLPGSAALLSIGGGNFQTTVVATAFASPLTVHLQDRFGNPVVGAPITFTVPASGASAQLALTSAPTNADGDAIVLATANTKRGDYQVFASALVGAAPVVFTLGNLPGAVASVDALPLASPQTTQVGTGFLSPLGVVALDAFGNRVPGVTVSFDAPGVGASASLSVPSAVTDPTGTATTIAIANQSAGTYIVAVTVDGVTLPLEITLTNTVGTARSLVAISGAGQRTIATTAFGAPVRLQVVDGFGNPIARTPVTLSTPASGPSGSLSSTSITSDDEGVVSVTVVANAVPGSFAVVATTPSGAAPTQVTMMIDPIPTTTTVMADTTSPIGQPVLARVTVTATILVPTGDVEIVDHDGTVLGHATLDASGSADIEILLRTRGDNIIGARFPATGAFGASDSSAVIIKATEDTGRLTGAGTDGCSAGRSGGGLAALLALALLVATRRRSARATAMLRSVVVTALACALLPALATTASAQTAGARAIARLDPAAADSDWFAADSIRFAGHRDVSVAVTGDYAYRPLVIYNADSTRRVDIVREQLLLHFGGAVTLYDRFRLSATAPLSPYQDGDAADYNGMSLPSPTYAFGDVTVAADMRFSGARGARFRAAAGVGVVFPTGSETNYTSDGIFAGEAHILVAGTMNRFEYAGSAKALIRQVTEIAGAEFGSELRLDLAAGIRLARGKLLLGPEAAAVVSVTSDTGTGHPVELGLGAHYRLRPDILLSAGASAGLVHAIGIPEARALLSFAWTL